MPARATLWSLFVLLLLTVAACQPQDAPAAPTPLDLSSLYREPTARPSPLPTPTAQRVVEFWTDDNESEWIAVYEEVAARFMAEHPDVTVRLVPVDEASLAARLAVAREADALPDIARLGIERVATFASDGLIDYEATAAVVESIGAEAFRGSTLSMVTHPDTGQLMAIPYDGWVQAIWYRADLFEERGLEPPTTWEAIRTAAATLPHAGDLEYGIVLPTDPQQNYVQQVFEQVAISNGAWPFDEAGNVTMNTPEMIGALTWYTSLQAYAMPGPQYWRGAREAYLRDQAGQFFFSTYIMDDLVEGVSFEEGYPLEPAVDDLASKTGFAAVLQGPQGSATYGQLVTLAILRGADPAAREVAEFFLTEGYLDVLSLAPFGKVPVLEGAVDEWRQSSDYFRFYSDETLAQIVNGYDTMQRWFLRPDYDAQERAVIGEIEGRLLIPQVVYEIAIEHSLTPEEAADRLQREVEALVEAR